MISGLFATGTSREMRRAYQSQSAGERAERTTAKMRIENETLSRDIEKLFMITEALWMILKDQHGYTDEQLIEMIYNIDVRDGRLDGKVAKKPNPACPECGRVLIGKHPLCLYCGSAVKRDPFER
jgi:ribosomal protein S27AE